MKKSLKVASRHGVPKNTPRQFIAAESAIFADNFHSKPPLDFGERRLTRLNNLACDDIGINNRKTPPAQQLGRS